MATHRATRMVVCGLALALAVIGCSPRSLAHRPGQAEPGNPGLTAPAPVAMPSARPSPAAGATAAIGQGSLGASGKAGTSSNQPANQPTSQPVKQVTVQPTAVPPTLTPSPTPIPALRRLTEGGCCTGPFWSPDSRRVLFIDKPGPDAPVGIWGVDVTQPGAAPELFTERIAYYTADLAFLVEQSGEATVIERLEDGVRWTVPAGGRSVSISPGRTRVAWSVSNEDLPFERRTTQIWVADLSTSSRQSLDGTDGRQVAALPRGGLSGWVSDDVLMVSGRESFESREQVLYTLSLTDGTQVEVVRSERLRGGLLSPDGQWLAYYVALSADPAENGLWLVRTDGSGRRQLDRALFGAYQWRDSGRLLIIPFQPEAASHELWELDVETGEARRLTDPAVTPFKIANGDWTVSPDGRYLAFVESRDRSIWVLGPLSSR